MARPRLVRTKDGGEVTLKNVSPEVADKVKALLEGKEEMATTATATAATAAPAQATETTLDKSKLKGISLGTFKSADNSWKVAVFKYDPANPAAVVLDTIVNGGDEKAYAVERFKILAAENDLV